MTAINFMMARREVAEDLAQTLSGVVPCPIVVSGPQRGRSRRYSGPELLELHFPFVHCWNPGVSTLKLATVCESCGRVSYIVEGVERRRHEEKIDDRWTMVERQPRKDGEGIIVFGADLGDLDFFTFGDWLPICTERAKDYIEQREWTNVSFVEYGEVVDEGWTGS